jgi:hypothetical protein
MNKADSVSSQASDMLQKSRGISKRALFQPRKRMSRNPGSTRLYTVSKTPFEDRSGLKTNAPIHKDVFSTLDSDGNFLPQEYVLNSKKYIKEVSTFFKGYDKENPPIWINENSFLNRRFRAGAYEDQNDKKYDKREPIRQTLSTRRRVKRKSKSFDDFIEKI